MTTGSRRPRARRCASGGWREMNGEEVNIGMLDMMRHAVAGDGEATYRNYYCAGIDGEEARSWEILCGLGLARRGREINDGRDVYFHVTDDGRAFLQTMRMDTEGEAAPALR